MLGKNHESNMSNNNVLEDYEAHLNRQNYVDMNDSIYKMMEDMVQDIHSKEKDLQDQYEEEKRFLSSNNKSIMSMNKSVMSAFSPDPPQQFNQKQKKIDKHGKEPRDKYKKYKPSENMKENDL